MYNIPSLLFIQKRSATGVHPVRMRLPVYAGEPASKKNTHSAHLPVALWLSVSEPLIHLSRCASFPHCAPSLVVASRRAILPTTPHPIAGCAALDDCGRVSSGAGVAAIGQLRRVRAWAVSRCWRIVGGPCRCCTGEMHAPPTTFRAGVELHNDECPFVRAAR
jgi:hypothetical protein